MKEPKSQTWHNHIMLGVALFFMSITVFGQPDPPDLVSPVNDKYCNLTTLNLTWSNIPGDVYYNVLVDDNPAFNSPYADTNISGTNYFELGGLNKSTSYYWKVRTIDNANDTSVWSVDWLFTTIPLPVTAPGIIAPVDGATCQALELTCEWDTIITSTDAYSFQLDTNPDFSSPIINQDWLKKTRPLTGLSYGTTYYWRVTGSDGCGLPGIWSDTASFTTLITSIANPELSEPADAATCQPLSPTLSWAAVEHAAEYKLEVDDNDDFSSPEYSDTATGTSQNCDELSENTVYYWRIAAIGTCEIIGDWTAARSFETGIGVLPAPALSAPSNNSTKQALSLNLSWSPVTGSTSYDVQLDDNDDFSSPLYDEEVTDLHRTANELSAGETYYWRVRAVEECSASDWSETWQFETNSDLIGLEELGSNQNGFILGQNYPNPFNGSTTIEFMLPASGQVDLEFMDLQGKTLETFTGYYSAGTHSMEIDLKGKINEGVYIYRMRTESFTDTKICVFK